MAGDRSGAAETQPESKVEHRTAKILVVDDDADLRDVITYVLRRQQFEVVTASDGLQALEAFAREAPDLVILDVNMPRLDGFEVCQRIRARSPVPIIMLTVRDDDVDVVGALRLGADEYVTKPFSTSQLVARVAALLRRAAQEPGTRSHETGDSAHGATEAPPVAFRLDLAAHSVASHGRKFQLDPVEYKIMDYLFQQTGRPVAPSELIEHVWGAGRGSEQLLKVYVRRLREKLEVDPDHPRLLRAERGRGLVLDV